MALCCLTWIPELWIQLIELFMVHENVSVPHFPDDVIINILSRLPAEDVIKYRRVCRQWRALSSTPYFTEMHLRRVKPALFVQASYGKHSTTPDIHFFIFEETEKDIKITKICMGWLHSVMDGFPILDGSCNGLLLFRTNRWSDVTTVVNPITRANVTVNSPVRGGGFYLIFFDPFIQDYKLLYLCKQGNCYQYFIYELQSKKWRQISSFHYKPSNYSPAIVNGHVHWMARHEFMNESVESNVPPCRDAILVFNMGTEDFRALRHPGHECGSRGWHQRMFLVEMEEKLSLCHVQDLLIKIWVLEDYGNWEWVSRFKVQLDCNVGPYYETIEVVNIQNNLLFGLSSRGLVCYHLNLENIKEIKMSAMRLRSPSIYQFNTYTYAKSFVTFNA